MKVALILTVALLGTLPGVGALAKEPPSPCGPIFGVGYGPFDYRTESKETKERVESAHFTADVESLKKGATGLLAQDIDYTLRAFPNHPRALLAMSTLGLRSKSVKPPGANWTVHCYFERAIRGVPMMCSCDWFTEFT